MDIVKKNIVSIICGVIAIIAIIASFFPPSGYAADLQARLDKGKQQHGTLIGLLSKTRKLPVLSPDASGDQPLSTFPNQEIIDKGKGVVSQVEAQSQRMRDTAVALNAKKLLVA